MNSSLIQRAKQGDVEAIATLLNQRLKSQNISASLTNKDATLHIELRSPKSISPAPVLHYLQQAFRRLQAKNIERLRVEAYTGPEEDPQEYQPPAWQKEILLNQADSSEHTSSKTSGYSNLGSESHASTRSDVKQQKPRQTLPPRSVQPKFTFANSRIRNRNSRGQPKERSPSSAKQQRIIISITIEWLLANGLTGVFLLIFLGIVWTLGRVFISGLLLFLILSPIGQPLIFIAFGLVFGIVQTLVVARRLDNAGWWFVATLIGFASIIPVALVTRQLPVALLPFILFGTVPLFQWLAIARQIKQSYCWLIVNGISLLFVQSVVWRIVRKTLLFSPLHDGTEIGRVFLPLTIIALWLITSLMLGLTLGYLLRDRRDHAIHFSNLFERVPFLA